MADEARAMLDALMGADRNASLPRGASGFSQNESFQQSRRGNRKSCYDYDICPLYCAWGVDVFDLFTNTKSDLGPNPCVVQEDAREEYLSLPDHEKDRLGYEVMLYRKLGDLVKSCDRTVSRNKEKLRAEIAKNAKARGDSSNNTDLATNVKDEVFVETANSMAELELCEADVDDLVSKLLSLDEEFKSVWSQVCEEQARCRAELEDVSPPPLSSNTLDGEENCVQNRSEGDIDTIKVNDEMNNSASAESESAVNETSTSLDEKAQENNNDDKASTVDAIDVHDSTTQVQEVNEPENTKNDNYHDGEAVIQNSQIKELSSVEKELKLRLHSISSEQQKIMSDIVNITTLKIVPLRDNIQNLQKQLYYVRTDTSMDKQVCEVSGNFMSSRDADERIAAHYAGKQYVGWKLVREKYDELHKKYGNGRMMGGQGNYPNRQGGGPPPPRHGYGPPRPGDYGYGGEMNYPPQPGYYNNHSSGRSRGNGRSGKRSPSPGRWERDRAPPSHRNNQYQHGGGRRDDRGHWGGRR
jgi:hypothetical protein